MMFFRNKFQPESPPPLLSDAEMKRLHEEIFDEPVSVEILLEMLSRARSSGPPGRQLEWVMTTSMWNRIRQLGSPRTAYFEFSTKPVDLVPRLFDVPVAIEPLAKLGLREVAP